MLYLIMAVLAAVTPEAEVAADYGEPDIYRISMPDYTAYGMNNFEMKMLMNVYIDSLEVELVTLSDELAEEFSRCPELLENLERSHDSFMEESLAWASLAEERMWWDTKSAERYDGTARGYTFAFTLGQRY